MADARDTETGLSIRFIREWKPENHKFVNYVDLSLISCRWLGHTYDNNPDESVCAVCGAVKVSA